MIRLRAEAPFTSHPLPLPSPIVLPRTRAFVAMIRATAPSTYILAPQSEAPPSGTTTETTYSNAIPLHHHHLCFFPLLTVERMFMRLAYRFRRGYALPFDS
ncbi:hypothetical protein Tco_1144516 [Tanacetum coccineum]